MKKTIAMFAVLMFAAVLAGRLVAAPVQDKTIGVARDSVSLLRGIDYKTALPLVTLKSAEAKKAAPAIGSFFFPYGAELKTVQKQWEFLGLIPAGYSLEKNLGVFASARTRAYYDPGGARVVFTEGAKTPGWTSPLVDKTMETLGVAEPEFVAAHECAYGLLDSNYGVGALVKAQGADPDRAAAARALVNGDALMTTMDFLVRNYGISALFLPSPENVIKQFLPVVTYIGKPELAAAPQAVRDAVAFPLVDGTAFVVHVRKTGGFDLLNSAYSSPPISTEQILHPEKFFEKRDNPIGISIPDLASALPKGAKTTASGALGEWGLREVMTVWLGEAGEAASAADGWGGDLFVVVESPDGKRIGALYSTWDSADEAKMFEGVFRRAARKKYGAGGAEVKAVGRDVAALIGADAKTADKLWEKLWQTTKTPVVVPPPVPQKPTAEDVLNYQRTFLSMFDNIAAKQPEMPKYWLINGDNFTNGKYGYSVTKPSADWQYQRLHIGGQFISEFTAVNTKDLGANFTVFTFKKYGPKDSDNPVDAMVDFMGSQMQNFKKMGEEKGKVGGLPARSVTFSGYAVMPLKIRYTEIFGDKFTYVVTWWALTSNFDRLKPEYEKFMKSFKVVPVMK